LLEQWWCEFYLPAIKMGYDMVGHNILEFDVPFLVKRSWMLGLDVPDSVWHGKWLSPFLVDTMDKWKCGSRQGQYNSLDDIARALGVGKKTEGMNGGDFHRLYFGTVPQRDEAMNYLKNDVELTRSVARRLGLI
jgi:DNA polymerase III epsilon subunit-like protein